MNDARENKKITNQNQSKLSLNYINGFRDSAFVVTTKEKEQNH